MKKRKNIITVAIDSPAAAGAGTQAKLISKHYNLFYLDTGKIYRYIGNLKLVLWPLNNTDALLKGAVINGTVLLDIQDKDTFLNYSGFRMKKL